MQKIIFSKRAEKEREEAILYVFDKFGIARARKFITEIDKTLESILENPTTYPLIEKGQPYRKILIRKEVSVVYRTKGKKIYVFSFWNNRRGPKNMRLK